jgi:hypothetical protein
MFAVSLCTHQHGQKIHFSFKTKQSVAILKKGHWMSFWASAGESRQYCLEYLDAVIIELLE